MNAFQTSGLKTKAVCEGSPANPWTAEKVNIADKWEPTKLRTSCLFRELIIAA